jgi:hypothetical protein
MRKLFLDDVRKPYDHTWDVVRSHAAFVDFINEHGCPDVISFDHDLAEEHYEHGHTSGFQQFDYEAVKEPTGLESARWLITSGHLPSAVIVHSFNPVGAQNIAREFHGKTKVLIAPYGTMNFGNADTQQPTEENKA